MGMDINATDYRWPNAVWAWEFLRRNKEYRQAYEHYGSPGPLQSILPGGSRFLLGNQRYEEAREWGLLYFADPALSAYEAGVLWKPSQFTATIPVSLRDPEREKDRARYASIHETDMVILSELCCQRLIFESINQSRHVLLAPRRLWIQLYCDSTYPACDNALINFRIQGAKHAYKRMNSVKQLLSLHRSMGRKISAIGYVRNADMFREALVALDIYGMGGSYQDIAKSLYGKKRVEKNWNNGCSDMKQKARRALNRGRNYRDGKYLELLS